MKAFLLIALCVGLACAASLGNTKEDLVRALEEELEKAEDRRDFEEETAEKRAQAVEAEEREAMLKEEAGEKRTQFEGGEEERSLDDLRAELIRALQERLANDHADDRRAFLEAEAAEKQEQHERSMQAARDALLKKDQGDKGHIFGGDDQERSLEDLKAELVRALEERLDDDHDEHEDGRAFLEAEAAEKKEQHERSMEAAPDALLKKDAEKGHLFGGDEEERSLEDLKAELIRALQERLADDHDNDDDRRAFLEAEAAEKQEQHERSMEAARDALLKKDTEKGHLFGGDEEERSLEDLKAELIRALQETLADDKREMAVEREPLFGRELAEKDALDEELFQREGNLFGGDNEWVEY